MKTIFIVFMCLLSQLSHAEMPNWYNSKDYRLDRPVGGMSYEEQDLFLLGRSFFSIPWVFAPSATTARDGLGPLFNGNTCTSCHRGNGLGEAYTKAGEISRAMVTKLSRKSGKRVPFYGHQIAVNGLMDVPFEGLPTRTYTPVVVTYPDGLTVTLQKPTYGLKHLNYGALPDDIIIVQRRAPALVGLGALSRVTDNEILTFSDPEDKDGDSISGRPNWVLNAKGKRRLGRLTAKAAVATSRQQSADAAVNDMGLTNVVFPQENCTPEQTACLNAAKGRPDPYKMTMDLTPKRLEAITFFVNNTRIPVPKLDAQARYGKELFTAIGCSSCHRSDMLTRNGEIIHPYSDLLLHDMGEGLADGRREFEATGSEFRTAPLWGISSHAKTLKSKTPHYLHDGRAATVEQAILWHAGEAKHVKENFMKLPAKEREAIFAFINRL